MANSLKVILFLLCSTSAWAGNVRQGWLAPLAPCTASREFYRIGEVTGCDGWTEAKEYIGAWGFGRKDEKGDYQFGCFYATSRVDTTGTVRYACVASRDQSNINLNFPDDPYLASIPE